MRKGSKALLSTSGVMPTPEFITAILTYWPGATSYSRLVISSSRYTFAVSIVSYPRPAMASRALTARFKIAVSSWFASADIVYRSFPVQSPS